MNMQDKTNVSIYDSDFLEPIYEKLKTGPVLFLVCYSSCGGVSFVSIARNKEDLDKLLDDRKEFRHQARIIAWLNPELAFEGNLDSSILELIWKYSLLIFSDRSQQEELDWIFENKGKYCSIFKDPKWHESHLRAYVPLLDGRIEPGAY